MRDIRLFDVLTHAFLYFILFGSFVNLIPFGESKEYSALFRIATGLLQFEAFLVDNVDGKEDVVD